MAERIAALGGRAEGTISMVGQRTKLAAYPLDIVDGRDHVDAVSTALATVGQAVRGAIDQATEFGDADTADLFTEISRDIDKYLWFVESHLQGESVNADRAGQQTVEFRFRRMNKTSDQIGTKDGRIDNVDRR